MIWIIQDSSPTSTLRNSCFEDYEGNNEDYSGRFQEKLLEEQYKRQAKLCNRSFSFFGIFCFNQGRYEERARLAQCGVVQRQPQDVQMAVRSDMDESLPDTLQRRTDEEVFTFTLPVWTSRRLLMWLGRKRMGKLLCHKATHRWMTAALSREMRCMKGHGTFENKEKS